MPAGNTKQIGSPAIKAGDKKGKPRTQGKKAKCGRSFSLRAQTVKCEKQLALKAALDKGRPNNNSRKSGFPRLQATCHTSNAVNPSALFQLKPVSV